jgi:hypothetical protein
MIMFRLYLEILALNVGVSSFAVLAVAAVRGQAPAAQDLIFSAAVQVLFVSLVFALRKLLRMHDDRVAARAVARHTGAQLANFKTALRNQAPDRPDFSVVGQFEKLAH